MREGGQGDARDPARSSVKHGLPETLTARRARVLTNKPTSVSFRPVPAGGGEPRRVLLAGPSGPSRR